MTWAGAAVLALTGAWLAGGATVLLAVVPALALDEWRAHVAARPPAAPRNPSQTRLHYGVSAITVMSVSTEHQPPGGSSDTT